MLKESDKDETRVSCFASGSHLLPRNSSCPFKHLDCWDHISQLFSSSTAATRNRTTAKCTKRVQSSCLPFIKKGYCTNPEMIECCPEHCRITC
uniref:ShKT domain-containing protein n=1 Tax=Haemonchus contortus TaxID=6289 RepID=A0A7I4YCU6_HAECO